MAVMAPAVCIPGAARRLMLRRALGVDAELALSVTWPAPDRGRALEDYEEPAGGGYERIWIPSEDWRFADEDLETALETPPRLFRFTGPLQNARDIVAQLVIDAATGMLLWAEAFPDGAVPVEGPGDLTVVPRMRLLLPRGSG